jgi:hypothetical protein
VRAIASTLLIAAGAALALYAAAVAALAAAGRRTDAAALARFVPDCVVLVRRLLGDPRVPRPTKLMLVALLAYLLSPIDLALALRHLVRTAGPQVVSRHWPGPERSLAVVLRLAGAPYRRVP